MRIKSGRAAESGWRLASLSREKEESGRVSTVVMSGGTGTAARRLVRVGRARVAERTRARAVRKSRAVRSGHAANPAAAAVGARQALRVGGSGPSRRCLRASSVADNESTKGDAGSEVKEEEPGR